MFDNLWKMVTALYEAACGVVRWLTGNTVRIIVVLGIVVVLPLAITLGGIIFNRSESSRGTAWREYFQAREEVMSQREDVEWLEDLVLLGPQGDFKGDALRASNVPKLWALQFAADMELGDGARLIYSSQEESQQRLLHAIELYNRIELSSASIGGLLHERVILGKAHAHEILLACSADVAEFKKNYTAAIQSFDQLSAIATNSSLTLVAQQRKKQLVKYGEEIWTDGNISPASFYSWLSQYTPPELPINPFPSNPVPGTPPPGPAFPDPGELLPPPSLGPPTGQAPAPPEGESGDPEGEDDASPADDAPDEE